MTHARFMTALLAGVTALALALPAPARAGNDTAKIIAGTAALVIIGVAIAEALDDDDDVYVSRYGYRPYRTYRHHRYDAYRYQRHHHRHHRHHKRHHRHNDW